MFDFVDTSPECLNNVSYCPSINKTSRSPKSSIVDSEATPCKSCGVIHNANSKCKVFIGNTCYSPSIEGTIVGGREKSRIRMVPEAEVFDIPAKNIGRRDYDVSNHRLQKVGGTYMRFERNCMHGPYAPEARSRPTDILSSTRYCAPDRHALRAALGCLKAASLSDEVNVRSRTPMIWSSRDFENSFIFMSSNSCLHLRNTGDEYVDEDDPDHPCDAKSYMHIAIDYSIAEDGRSRKWDRLASIFQHSESWDDYFHFGDVPGVHERIQVAGCRRTSDGMPSDLNSPNYPEVEDDVCGELLRPPSEAISYVFVEYCCEPDSHLCDEKYRIDPEGKAVLLIRLTELTDMTSQRGMVVALESLEPYIDVLPIFLWGSLPCTLGSTFQHINKKKSANWTSRKEFLSNQFEKLFENFMTLADIVVKSKSGHVIYEWPTGCSLWQNHLVEDMVQSFNMSAVDIHGCMLGLTSLEGNPMKKPWTLKTTMSQLQEVFRGDLCDGSHEHQVIQGKNTSRSSIYPWMMTDKVHQAIQLQIAKDGENKTQNINKNISHYELSQTM